MIEDLSRRVFLTLLGALAPVLQSQGAASQPGTIPLTAIHHMAIKVSDPERSLKWYQGLFGMPVVARQGDTTILRVGDGPQFMTITAAKNSMPGITRIGFGITELKKGSVLEILSRRGVEPSLHENRPAEIHFRDPAGIAVQLQDSSFAGGKSADSPQPAPPQGLLQLRDYNHFTIFVPDAKGNVQFYQRLFGLGIDTYQGPMPIIRVGKGNQFLAFVGGRSKAFVHHACFVVENFDPDRILSLLADQGIKPRTSKRGPAGPLQSYVVMRMPNRGGAPKGTPELYLTDPDGILLQIQDVRYSGGAGYLGDRRGTSKQGK